MRRTILLLATLSLTVLLASGVALAVTRIGTDGPDTLRGTNRADNLLGLGGNDDLFALAGNDNLQGGPGRDNVLGGSEFFTYAFGGDKNLVGGPGNDLVSGGSGSDNIAGEEGNDYLVDSVFREASKDELTAGDGNDVIDVLNNPAAKDSVACGDGLDRVLADSKDVIAPDCERVLVGIVSILRFYRSIPDSWWEGLPPYPGHEI
jgi:Ca2+-binding RTX toxin-like protein